MLYGRAFLAPSPAKAFTQAGTLEVFDEDVQTGNPVLTYFHFSNPDLKPEVLNTIETGFSWFIGSNFSLSGNLFTTKIRDAIDLYASLPPGYDSDLNFDALRSEIALNVGTISIGGASFIINHLLNWKNNQVNSYVSWSLTDGKTNFDEGIETSDRLFYTAKQVIKGGVDISSRIFGLSARVVYRGESFAARKDWEYNTVENYANYEGFYYSNDPYAVVNLGGSIRLLNKRDISVSLTAKVSNALNVKYYNVYVGGEEGLTRTPQDPFRINTGLIVELK
jgi:outer membrane receptor protein involved in Fe transport